MFKTEKMPTTDKRIHRMTQVLGTIHSGMTNVLWKEFISFYNEMRIKAQLSRNFGGTE